MAALPGALCRNLRTPLTLSRRRSIGPGVARQLSQTKKGFDAL